MDQPRFNIADPVLERPVQMLLASVEQTWMYASDVKEREDAGMSTVRFVGKICVKAAPSDAACGASLERFPV